MSNVLWIVVRYRSDDGGDWTENICVFDNEDRAFKYAEKCNIELFADKPRYTEAQLAYHAKFLDAEELDKLRKTIAIYDPIDDGHDAFRDLSLTEYFAHDIVEPFILSGKLSEGYAVKEWRKAWKALTSDERMLLLSNSACKPYGVEIVSFNLDFE